MTTSVAARTAAVMESDVRRARRRSATLAVVVAAAAFVAYASTAARTITFWEGAHYPLLARTLSIANPPGSLLLTWIGWTLGGLPFASPMAFRLSLIAALIVATTVAVLARIGVGLGVARDGAPTAAAVTGGAVAGLTYAFAVTPWTYATQFTPYALSALSTALILAAFLRWWRRAESTDAIGAAALVALLVGLDVSVHRANLVLVPALLFGVLLRRPVVLVRPGAIAMLVLAFAAGAATQLLYIPMSRREPFLDMADADSPRALWHFIRMDLVGGGFLVNVWPRRADVVHVQLADLGRFLRENLVGGRWGWPVAAAFVLTGWIALARRSARLAVALLGTALAAGLGPVLFFNRPEHYFRTLDRHYLPCLVALMPLLAAGVSALLATVRVRGGAAAGAFAVLLAAALPIREALHNARACDLSRARFAETYARDMLEPLPPNTILLTNGDNDSFPPWYLQRVEGVRPDVVVINVPTSMTTAGTRRVRSSDPALATFTPRLDTPSAMDTIIVDLTRRCLRRRPVYFAATLVLPTPVQGLTDSLQPEGLVWRVPAPGDRRIGDLAPLERFVSQRLPRAGLDDPRQHMDDDFRALGMNYAAAAFRLAVAQASRGEARAALATLATLERYDPESNWPPWSGELKDGVARERRQLEAALRSGASPR